MRLYILYCTSTCNPYRWVSDQLNMMNILVHTYIKGQCHDNVDHFLFCLKDSTYSIYEQAKTVPRSSLLREDLQ